MDRQGKRFPAIIASAILAVALPFASLAFDPATYAESSVLADGHWVKVSVTQSGLHLIPASTLRSLGFSNPEKVVVYGYGGGAVSDNLTLEEYVDDLPAIAAWADNRGLWFYAEGPETVSWKSESVTRTLNPYSVESCYFLTEGESKPLPVVGATSIVDAPASYGTSYAFHEQELVSYGSSGRMLFGEDLRVMPSRSVTFDLPGVAKGSDVTVMASVASKTTGVSNFSLTAGGVEIAKCDMPAVKDSEYGVWKSVSASFAASGERADIGIRFAPSGLFHSANIDAVTINYRRELKLDQGYIEFMSSDGSLSLSAAGNNPRVVDVTDPTDPVEMQTVDMGGGVIGWSTPYSGTRRYIAWNDAVKPLEVSAAGKLSNQDIHATLRSADPDMIIIHAPGLRAPAERIATLHRDVDGLSVMVVDQRQVFNEFSSGSPDPGAFRRLLKMAYDCGHVRYALIMGRGWFDNRRLTAVSPVGEAFSTPIWESDESLGEHTSYTTDDYLAMLEDGAGLRPAADRHCIAVGRIPAANLQEAEDYVRKLERYVKEPPAGEWHNRVIMLADDGDLGIHMTQSEAQIGGFMKTTTGKRMVYEKVYIDAYPLRGGVCETGREKLHRLLSEGGLWWNYVGHANKYYLTGQGVMTLNDITGLSNKRWPVFFGATCYFMQWDGTDRSGAEKLFFNPSGGIIAAISATRTAFISENGRLGSALSEEAFATGSDGRQVTLGEALMNAKNRLAGPAGESNSNKLRFVLMGDPAMRPSIAALHALVSSIDGVSTGDNGEDIVVAGRSVATIEGEVTDTDGALAADFNGNVTLRLYDAETSVLTTGRSIDGTDGRQIVFDDHGQLLSAATDTVVGGRWTVRVPIPENIEGNYRNAMVSVAASSHDGQYGAGVETGFFVYGLDDRLSSDTVPPVIENIMLNYGSFTDGGTTGPDPMLIATVTDNVGISLSTAGVGRSMSILIDGNRLLTDVASHYTPMSEVGNGGVISYPLTGLTDGKHTLMLTVYDTSGNYSEQSITFTVDSRLAPVVTDIYADANPASAEVNFYVVHDRPDARLTVTVSVYSLLGRLVWSSSVTGASDMTISAPVRWNLTDMGGNRVGRGIYIYRAEIVGNGSRSVSKAKKIAVSGQ